MKSKLNFPYAELPLAEFPLVRQNEVLIYSEKKWFKMLIMFSFIFVVDTKITFDYNFAAPLNSHHL